MLERHAFRPHPGARAAPSDGKCAAYPLNDPRHNYLLAALPQAEYEHLLPNLEPAALPSGWTVHGAGAQEKYLFFLTAGIVSRSYTMENGDSAVFAISGCEGVIGLASFLGGGTIPSQAVMLSAGYAYRVRSDLLKNDFDHNGSILHLLLRYTQTLIAQMTQAAACYRHHSVGQQLCRLILASLDRLGSNELNMTQELIAQMLGVRRESVTEEAGVLQREGLIHYNRGHIAVLDRSRLEARVCECYAVVKQEFDRLLRYKPPLAELACTARTSNAISVPEYPAELELA